MQSHTSESGSHAHSDPVAGLGLAWLICLYGHEGSAPNQSIFLDHFEKLAERCAKSSYGEYLMSIYRAFAKSRRAEF
jgi:hypothetical protein